MSSSKTEGLFQLIKSLTKAEKRHFKLYATRIRSSQDAKYLHLFDVLDKMEQYDEGILLKKVNGIKKTQLSNTKAHLYKQILSSLRGLHQAHSLELQIREQLDHARILYDKGLYKHSLNILEKTKNAAIQSEQNTLALEAIEFEKLIESQYITRSLNNRAEQLSSESEYFSQTILTTQTLSNLALRLYGLYLNVGYVRNRRDLLLMKRFFKANLPELSPAKLSFFEKLYLYQSYVWYCYIIQDFLMSYRYAQKWVDLFVKRPDMIEKYPTLYIKGLHNLLAALFNLGHYHRFISTLQQLENFASKNQHLDQNVEILTFLYLYTNRINRHYMEGRFTDGLALIPELEDKLEHYHIHLDSHRILVFYYKIACLYFGSGNNKKAIFYLEKIIRNRDVNLRSDIHCFARILNLIAHYEEGLDEKLEYQVKSVYHFLGKMEELQLIQKEIFLFLRNLGSIDPNSLKREFTKLRNKIAEHSRKPFEKRSLLYLDILSWLDSKIENRPVQEVIAGKRKAKVSVLD